MCRRLARCSITPPKKLWCTNMPACAYDRMSTVEYIPNKTKNHWLAHWESADP